MKNLYDITTRNSVRDCILEMDQEDVLEVGGPIVNNTRFEARTRDQQAIICIAHAGHFYDYAIYQPATRFESKNLFREVEETKSPKRFQPTWGRVQQQAGLAYLRIIQWNHASKYCSEMLKSSCYPSPKLLDEFEGFVEKVEGSTAYITLTSQSGDTIYGEYPTDDLTKQGVHERRRFKLQAYESVSGVDFVITPILPPTSVEEFEQSIDETLRNSIGELDAQSDY